MRIIAFGGVGPSSNRIAAIGAKLVSIKSPCLKHHGCIVSRAAATDSLISTSAGQFRDRLRTVGLRRVGKRLEVLKIWFARNACLNLLVLFSLGIRTADAAGECNITGPYYQLASDTVEWQMRIVNGPKLCSAHSLSRRRKYYFDRPFLRRNLVR
jgi:hypothetical protein